MATTNPLFQRGTSYAEQHRIAKAKLPEGGPQPDTFLVAVRQHVEEHDAETFLWFKVKPSTNVAKVKKGYISMCNVQVTFKHANGPISDTTHMKDLNHFGDSIVVFTAHEENQSSTPSSSGPSCQTRTPLQTIHSQTHNIIPIVKSEPKPDNQVLSPYQNGRPSSMTAPSLAHIKNENNTSSPLSSSSSPTNASLTGQGFGKYAGNHGGFGGPPQSPAAVKDEGESIPMKEQDPATETLDAPAPKSNRLQKLIEEGSPERLEAEVKTYKEFLNSLGGPLEAKVSETTDVGYFLQQIENLCNEKPDTPTIIGVVGNTGAGKSSVINAMLEEERLVPTNCMRACTAVVTEISWNSSENEDAKYRADIEFIQAADWEKDLRVSLTDLLDGNGQVSRDCSSAESEAGIAYAKIKAVYPNKTKEDLAGSTVEELMNEPEVRAVLGTTKNVEKAQPEPFYRALQNYVDSKEKSTTDGKKKKEKGEKKAMSFWPLIKVVRIYTKADALSTGAVVVDLPGVHDSNAARAAVAAGYMKQCTGLWIVAPINRAVDDKAAKSLMGESFKRQLKYDGTYSRITFICSKTDEINVTEASDSLGLEEQMREDWDRVDEIKEKQKSLKKTLKEIQESRAVYLEVMNDAEDAIEIWDKLKDNLDDGKEVFAPSDKSKKRKRTPEPKNSRKKAKKSSSAGEDFIDDDEEVDELANSDEESDDEFSGKGDSSAEEDEQVPLTMEQIEAKLAQLKDDKKQARRERMELDNKSKDSNKEIKTLEATRNHIDTAMSAICIEGRNKYSKGAIQQDFAAGIRELDQENAQFEDEDNFDPDEDIRNYDDVAKSLPVFCCSSTAYQKMSGRFKREPNVYGFRNKEETEIPQLQKHCKQLTENVRASNCRRFLTNLSQTLNSLKMWASNDGTGLKVSDAERAAEGRFLKARLQTLEKSLDQAVKDCLAEMNDTLAENIFEHYPEVTADAASKAVPTSASWGAPVNRLDRQAGGFYWATYKALCRRDGVFGNSQGTHDLNLQLAEPIIKQLASHWEKAFARRLPDVLKSFSRKSKGLLTAFHKEVETRSMKQGAGIAGLAMLGQQLRNYEALFENLSTEMMEIINNLQREANREFTPIIGSRLASAYEWCAAEVGPGQYKRMKEHMNDHVSDNLDMFSESCNQVKKRLTTMCRQVEEVMSNKADEVYMNMSRDYLEVISGNKVEGQMMQKWERQLRAEVSRIIEEREKADLVADEAEARAKLEVSSADASAGPGSEADQGEDTAHVGSGSDKMDVDGPVSTPGSESD